LFDGIDLADSATIDAHKWLFVPKACGVLLVRNNEALLATFGHATSYMVDVEENPVDRTLEYSRPFRSLKLWVAFRAHGADAIRSALEDNVQLAQRLAEMVAETPNLELVVEPQLSIVPFRRLPQQGSIDEHNSAIAKQMQLDGDAYVTSAIVDNKTVLRPCFTNFRTSLDDVAELLAIVEKTGYMLEHQGRLS
jgi:aromatic-L-amino-acid decarboxylase